MDDACPDSHFYSPITNSCEQGPSCAPDEVRLSGTCVSCPANTIPDSTLGECRQISKFVHFLT